MKRNILFNFKPNIQSSILIWLKYIENIHNKYIDFDLKKIKTIASKLNLLNLNATIFIVGGTNGKGSTCFTLEKILLLSGYKVGLYHSPHLIRYTERVRINGYEFPIYEHILSFKIIEDIRNNIPLTYFEYSTLSALILFKKSNLDILILEVGLGGNYDATNIIDSDVAIITNIDIDHAEILGDNREDIGKEKSGIFRSNKYAFIGKNMPKSIFKIANQKKTILYEENKDWIFNIDKNKKVWTYQDIHGTKIENLFLHDSIPIQNIAVALAAIKLSNINIKNNVINDAINKIFLFGRFNIIKKKKYKIILDVGHNPHAAKFLLKKISSIKINSVHAVIGMLKDKDIKKTIKIINPIIDYWYCATLNTFRSANADNIMLNLPKNNSKKFVNIIHAYKYACKQAKKNDIIIVFGSFYTVSEILKFIENKIFTKFYKIKND